METFSGSSMLQSQKRSQSKNEDQEKNAILTQIFQGTIGIEVWIRLKNPRRSRRIQKEQIQSQFFATALFNTIIKTGSIFRPTPVYKWSTLGSRPNHFLEKTYPMGYRQTIFVGWRLCTGAILQRKGVVHYKMLPPQPHP